MAKNNKATLNRLQRTRTKIQKFNKKKLHRLSVFRSNQHIYAQIIDDVNGLTIAAVNTTQKDFAGEKNTSNMAAVKQVATKLAKLSLAKGINALVFDRGSYKYHGKVKCIADTVREHGIVV